MMLNTVAFAPIPKASTRIVTTRKPGLSRNCREAYRKSFASPSSMLAIISDERSAFDVDYLRLNRRVLAPNFAATLAPEMPIVEPRNSLPVPFRYANEGILTT